MLSLTTSPFSLLLMYLLINQTKLILICISLSTVPALIQALGLPNTDLSIYGVKISRDKIESANNIYAQVVIFGIYWAFCLFKSSLADDFRTYCAAYRRIPFCLSWNVLQRFKKHIDVTYGIASVWLEKYTCELFSYIFAIAMWWFWQQIW